MYHGVMQLRPIRNRFDQLADHVDKFLYDARAILMIAAVALVAIVTFAATAVF